MDFCSSGLPEGYTWITNLTDAANQMWMVWNAKLIDCKIICNYINTYND